MKMTLDEAITHVEAMATLNEMYAKSNLGSVKLVMDPFSKAKFEQAAAECKTVAKEQRQLAEWLKELKQLREQTKTGHWIRQTDEHHDYYYECDQCEIAIEFDDIKNYCPNCGAKMVKLQEQESEV